MLRAHQPGKGPGMAKIDAHRNNDKKRQNGRFTPQGKKGRKKKGPQKADGHVNKYEKFSQAAVAMTRLEARRESERIRREREEREEHERHMGWRRRW